VIFGTLRNQKGDRDRLFDCYARNLEIICPAMMSESLTPYQLPR